MDSNAIFHHKVITGFGPVLTYAACEWFLIFLMLIDALLSYLLVWFARYCRLKMPCFLCSKLLHPLHWRLLLCRNHKTEVSSFMSCHNHDNNLADCRGMCDDCLLSFTKLTGPNPDMNRLLLGKLGYDLLSKSHFAKPRSCSCCNKPWSTRHHTQRLVRLGSRGRNSAGKPNIPAPRHLTRRGSNGSLKKMRESKSSSGAEYGEVRSRREGMAHVGYTELKIRSDSESEFMFSDDESFRQIIDFNVEQSEKEKSRSLKQIEDEKILNRKRDDLQEYHNEKVHVEDNETAGSRNQIEKEHETEEEHEDVLSELITMSEARPFSLGLPREDNEEVAEHNEDKDEVSGNSSPSGAEFLSPSGENSGIREIKSRAHDDSTYFAQNISDSSVKIEAFEEAMEQEDTDRVNGSGSVASELSSDDEETVGEASSKKEEDEVNENNVAEEYFSNEEEEGDEVNEQSEPLTSENVSGSVAEEQSSEEEDGSTGYSVAKSHSSNEEDVANEDSKPLTSNNDTSPATEDEHSGEKEHEAETKPLTPPEHSNKETSLEHSDKDSSKVTEETQSGSLELKHSASVESFVSISSDVEGESLVDKLKQQLEHERNSLRDLNKELEEERSASAIATNQTMAMITRLQEEKAALHMEALQYLRMMDEQAEHDMDALERANDVLADREKEIQDLEMELEYYRVKYPDEPREEILASMGILEDVETNEATATTTDETRNNIQTETTMSQPEN
ncbi:unnamed protein product [Cochlearia groenlandica]